MFDETLRLIVTLKECNPKKVLKFIIIT